MYSQSMRKIQTYSGPIPENKLKVHNICIHTLHFISTYIKYTIYIQYIQWDDKNGT